QALLIVTPGYRRGRGANGLTGPTTPLPELFAPGRRFWNRKQLARPPQASFRMSGTGKARPEGNVMHRQTRKNLLNLATGIAVAAAAVVVFLPAANAAPGTATNTVNVRSGPGTGYAVVDALRRGERVDVQRCQGSWCYVVKPGP